MLPENLVLRPNCLLTRVPLVFVSGPRSLFSPEKTGAPLQEFIAAHGYQITPLWMPFRSRKDRQDSLRTWLQNHSRKNFHFILAFDTWLELQEIFENNLHGSSTLTLINPDPSNLTTRSKNISIHSFTAQARTPLNYFLHELYCRISGSKALPFSQTLLFKNKLIYDRFLDHCIDLAENE